MNGADEKHSSHEQAEADGESDVGAEELEHGDSAFEDLAVEREEDRAHEGHDDAQNEADGNHREPR
jgi:hypothetical protein